MTFDNFPKTNRVHISEIKVGAFVVNLGLLLEVEEHTHHYCLIIERMKEKQVIKFEKNVLLTTEESLFSNVGDPVNL